MNPIVVTQQGKLEGLERGGMQVFLGIPYAAPPVGARRWLPPAPPERWSGVRRAQTASPAAPQNPIPIDILPILKLDGPQSEDCLYLNVWTPALDGAQRPVLFWIHGGGFTIGSGTQLLEDYDGSLARRGDCVMVSINYRLGPLGFLNLRELTNGAIPACGNEGLLDQIAALAWVRDNIASFGGDPDNVTIFGESAGGMSVGSLCGMPAAAGLFHKAIPQSGATNTASSLGRAVKVAERCAGILGTRDAAVLRALDVPTLLALQPKLVPGPGQQDPEIGAMPFQPCVDGDELPTSAIEAVRRGLARGVALLVGATSEEWKLFGAIDPTLQTLDEARLGPLCASRAPGGESIVSAYRTARAARGQSTTPRELFMAFETDRVFRVPAQRMLEAQAAHERRLYSYLVTWPSPAFGGMLGACHAVELGPLFGIHDKTPVLADFFGRGPAADALSRAMQEAWTAFAKSGDPSGPSLGRWPAWDAARRATMLLGEKCSVEHDPLGAERQAWDGAPDAVIGTL